MLLLDEPPLDHLDAIRQLADCPYHRLEDLSVPGVNYLCAAQD
jgi:hypothetical protein